MKLKKKVLKNGLTVIMEPRSLPVVSLSITNRFGAAYESSEIKGIAHFIEHLLFTGTKTRSHEQISSEIEKKGGILNAFTANEMTSYWFKLPSEHIFAGLDILTDMLNNPAFEEKKFEKEKKVIIEEIKMYRDNPRTHVSEILEGNLYDSPLGEGIIGSEETIKSISKEFVKEYFEENYNPSDYIVCIVGKANFERICRYLEKKFQKKKPFTKKIKVIKKINKETTQEKAGIDQAHFMFGIHAPLLKDPNFYALEVLDAYLCDGMSSKLFLKIREEKGLAYAVKSSINAEKNYSYYSIYVGTKKEAIPEIKKIILEEFQKAGDITQKDLNEAKERLLGVRKISSEESINVMNNLVYTELADKAEKYYEYEKKIKSVTLAQIKKLSKISSFSTAAIIPK